MLCCLAFEVNQKGKKARLVGVSWADHKSKKLLFWSVVLFYATTTNHFSIGLWHATKSGFYTTCNDQLSGMTEKKLPSTSQSQISNKKGVMVTVAWSAATLIHYSFLNPNKTTTSEKYAQQIDEMRQKLRLQPALVNRKDPILLHNNTQTHITQPTLPKLNKWVYKVLPHLHIHLTSPQLKHLDSFLQGKCFHNQQEDRPCFPRVCRILKRGFLRYRSKQTYFSLANMCWL